MYVMKPFTISLYWRLEILEMSTGYMFFKCGVDYILEYRKQLIT